MIYMDEIVMEMKLEEVRSYIFVEIIILSGGFCFENFCYLFEDYVVCLWVVVFVEIVL